MDSNIFASVYFIFCHSSKTKADKADDYSEDQKKKGVGEIEK